MRYEQLKEIVEANGYTFFDRGFYNLNLVGVRTNDDAANTFNDFMFIAYRDELKAEHCLGAHITTDPGVYYRRNPINPRGTGIIVPGQHRGVWGIGTHKGAPALVQRQKIRVYRDNDRDDKLDYDPSSTEAVMGGFNCHKSSPEGTSKYIGKWSAGCQVFANACDHEILMCLARRSALIYGDSFTYTLLTEGQLHGATN